MNDMKRENINSTKFDIPPELQNQVAITTLDKIYNWGRRSSVWPLMFGLACCAIEMICTAASRYDFARFGMEIMRPSPRQADLMIVSGTVTKKMIPQIVRLYNQMPEPKYVVAMGACASGGGPFKEGYNVVSGVDRYVPVDVYIPGCPPTPQALLHGLITLQRRSTPNRPRPCAGTGKSRYRRNPGAGVGPDIIDPRQYEIINRNHDESSLKQPARQKLRWLKAGLTRRTKMANRLLPPPHPRGADPKSDLD